MSSLGGFLFGNIDEEGKLDNEDFDEELRANLTSFSERIHDKKLFGIDDTLLTIEGEIISQSEEAGNKEFNQRSQNQGHNAAAASINQLSSTVRDEKRISLAPLPDAVDFEDINELAAEDLNSKLLSTEKEKEWRPTSPTIFPIENSQIINCEGTEDERVQGVPFDTRQILKFTRLSAKPELLNATGRSYSRYSSLRKIRLKRKHLHNKHVHLTENQLETFLTRTGSVFGSLSSSAARLRLSLVHLNTTSAVTNVTNFNRSKHSWYQSSRFHDLELILTEEKVSDASALNPYFKTFDIQVNIPENSHFHPFSLLEWEKNIHWSQEEDQENFGNQLNEKGGMFINFNSQAQNTPVTLNSSSTNTVSNRLSVASHPQSQAQAQSNSSLSSILSSLSLSGSGLGGDSATATALLALIRNQQMRSASISTGSISSARTQPSSHSRSSVSSLLPRALKYPKSSAARILNRPLQDGKWMDSIVWDVQRIDSTHLSTHLILPLDDPSLIFTPLPVENLSKKLSRAEKLIAKRLKKIRTDGSGNGNGLITSFSKSIPDKFNLSNDKYYEANSNNEQSSTDATGTNVGSSDSAIKSSNIISGSSLNANTTTANTSSASYSSISAIQLGLAPSVPALQHSIPALKLSPPAFQTCRTKSELRLWHRPRLAIPSGFKISNWARVRAPVKKSSTTTGHNQLISTTEICGDLKLTLSINPTGGIIRSAKKLTLKDSSRFVLLEYCEEFPSFIMNSGMGTYVVLYYRKKSPHDTFVPFSSFAHVHVLAFTDPSPFWMFGDIPAGASRYAICNGLFRAPLFLHKSSNCDFLIGHKTIDDSAHDTENFSNIGNEFFLRPLETAPTFLVGQEFPVAEVPGPHSRRHNMFCRQRLQVAAYRLFNKDLLVNNNSRKRLKIGRLLASFPQFSEGSIRKWLKDYAESTRTGKDSGVWLLKSDAPQFDEDELRALVTPELICQYESMMAEQQRISDAELLLFNPLSSASSTSDSSTITEDNDDSESEAANTTTLSKRRTNKLDPQIEEIISAAPWNTSSNFLTAVTSRISLKLRGVGDPSGRGEAFSFVKAPGEKGISSAATAGTEYRQEITKIWESQIQALSNGSINSNSLQSISTALNTNSLPDSCTLKISRRFGIDQWIHEEISDPLVIAAYLKMRFQNSTTNSASSNDKKFRRGFMAPTALPVLSASDAKPLSDPRASISVKRKRSASSTGEEGSKPKKKAALSSSTSALTAAVVEKNLQIKCGACGQIGHMRTNRVCPYFDTVPPPLPPRSGTTLTQSHNHNLKLKIKLTTTVDSDGNSAHNSDSNQGISISPSDSVDSIYPSPVLIPAPVARSKGPPILPLQSIRKRPRKLTPKQLHAHFLSNQSVEVRGKLAELSTFLIAIIDALLVLPTTPAFHKPVPRRLYPLYYKMIKSPIDLTTMRVKAVDFQYYSLSSFRKDFELLWENCVQFNGKDSPLSEVAQDMLVRVNASITGNEEIHAIDAFLQSNLQFIESDSTLTNEDSIVDSADVSILTDPEIDENEDEHENNENGQESKIVTEYTSMAQFENGNDDNNSNKYIDEA